MQGINTSILLDIGIVVFFILMLFIGYKQGIVKKLYGLVTLIISFIGAFYISLPLATFNPLYETSVSEVNLLINRCIYFGISVVALMILFFILGLFIKPLLQAALEKIKIINKLNQILGLAVNGIKGCIIIYLVLLVLLMPGIKGGNELVNNSYIGSRIVKIVPSLYNNINGLNDLVNTITGLTSDTTDTIITQGNDLGSSLASSARVINTMIDSNLISADTVSSYYKQYKSKIESYAGDITVTQDQYQEINKLLTYLEQNGNDTTQIRNKIRVE